jgi:hypothetical protein
MGIHIICPLICSLIYNTHVHYLDAPAGAEAPEASCTTHSKYLRSGTTTISCFLVRSRSSFISSSSSRSLSLSWSSAVLCAAPLTLGRDSCPISAVDIEPDRASVTPDALVVNAWICAARASAWVGLYGGLFGLFASVVALLLLSCAIVSGDPAVLAATPLAGFSVVEILPLFVRGAGRFAFAFAFPFPVPFPVDPVFAASRPVLCMIEPSLRERISVDWTPGREVRCESNAETC